MCVLSLIVWCVLCVLEPVTAVNFDGAVTMRIGRFLEVVCDGSWKERRREEEGNEGKRGGEEKNTGERRELAGEGGRRGCLVPGVTHCLGNSSGATCSRVEWSAQHVSMPATTRMCTAPRLRTRDTNTEARTNVWGHDTQPQPTAAAAYQPRAIEAVTV